MKALFTTALLFIGLLAGAQSGVSQSLEERVKNLLIDGRYQDAVELCEREMQDDRTGSLPYFMLSTVYLRALSYCNGSEFTDYLLASLAFQTYKKGHDKFNTHDPAILNEICSRMATMEDIFDRGYDNSSDYSVDCFGKTAHLYTKSDCQTYIDNQ